MKKDDGNFTVEEHLRVAREELQQKEEEEVVFIRPDLLRRNRFQPRLEFLPSELADMSASIKEKGIIHPVIVRRIDEPDWPEKFEIADGERRWRGGQMAGLTGIPAIIRQYTDHDMKDIAFICNDKAVDLTIYEKARYVSSRYDDLGSADAVAVKMSLHKKTVERYIRAYKAMSCCEEIEHIFKKLGKSVKIEYGLHLAAITDKILVFRNGVGEQSQDGDTKKKQTGASKNTREFNRILAALEKDIGKAIPTLVQRYNGSSSKKKKGEDKGKEGITPPESPASADLFSETDDELILQIKVSKKNVTQQAMEEAHDGIDAFLKRLNHCYAHPSGE